MYNSKFYLGMLHAMQQALRIAVLGSFPFRFSGTGSLVFQPAAGHGLGSRNGEWPRPKNDKQNGAF